MKRKKFYVSCERGENCGTAKNIDRDKKGDTLNQKKKEKKKEK